MDQLVAADTGDLISVVVAEHEQSIHRTNALLGYTETTLVLVGQEFEAAVDLHLLWGVEGVTSTEIALSWVRPQGGMTFLRWRPTPTKPVRSTVQALLMRRDRQLAQLPEDARDAIQASGRSAQWIGLETRWRRENKVLSTLPVNIQNVALSYEDAPAEFRNLGGERKDELGWLGGEEFVLIYRQESIFRFRASQLTCLSIREVPHFAGLSAYWEIGWVGEKGERHAFMEAPGMARYEGIVEDSADTFLAETGLRDHAYSPELSHSWLAQSESRQDSESAPSDGDTRSLRPPVSRSRPTPKRRA